MRKVRLPDSRALGFIVVMGLAIAIRVHDLMEVPAGYAEHAVVHHVNLSIPFYERLTPGLLRNPAGVQKIIDSVVDEQTGLSCLVTSIFFRLFGVTPTVTRLTSAALGCVTVLLAWAVGRRVFDAATGLCFAFLLAVEPWHVSISRYEDPEHVLSPLHALAALFFLWRARSLGKLRDYVIGGLVLGLAFYLYPPNQVLPLVAGVFLLYELAADRGLLRRDGGKIALALVVFVAVSLPAIGSFLAQGRAVPARTAYLDRTWKVDRVFPSEGFAARTAAELSQLFVKALDAWFATKGGGLGPVATGLFLLGLVICFIAIRRACNRDAAVLMLIALPLSFLPAVFGPDVTFRRLLLTATLALLLAGVALAWSVEVLKARGVPRTVLLGALMLGCAAYAWRNIDVYFHFVHVGESEIHLADREAATFIASDLDRSFFIWVVPTLDDVRDRRGYARLFTYRALLERPERRLQDVVEVVSKRDLATVLEEPRRIDRATVVLAELRHGDELRPLVLGRFPDCREFIRSDAAGRPLLIYWIRTGSSGSP